MAKIKQRPPAGRKHPNRRPDADSGSARGGDRDFIEDAVRTGYEVSEAWLRQGTRFARRLTNLSPPGMPANSAVYRRWMELYMELINNWFDMVGRYSDLMTVSEEAGDDGSRGYRDDYGDNGDYDDVDDHDDDDSDEWSWDDQSATVNVVFEVQSALRTRMDLQFHNGSATNHVEISSLVPLDGDGPAMSVNCSSPDEETLLVEIRSDPENLKGQYVGVVLDTANRQPVGTLNVQLG